MSLRRHMYSLGHYVFTSGRIGRLIPTCRLEVIPGDTFSGSVSMLCRLKGMAEPCIHPAFLDQFFFYVPNRILWDGWEDMITGEDADSVPTVSMTNAQAQQFLYGRVKKTAAGKFGYNALYLRAYNLIWNEFFRDQDYDSEVDLDNTGLLVARQLKNIYTKFRKSTEQIEVESEYAVSSNKVTIGASDIRDDLRTLRLRERRAMFGDRYFDVLRSWGIRTNYQWLDRPEYLGRSRNIVSFSDIPATAAGTNVTPGDLFGHGIVGLRHRFGRKVFPEHGYIVGLAVMRFIPIFADASPMDAFKKTIEDYWAPEYEMQSPVTVGDEQMAANEGGQVYGYLPKFEEYRSVPGLIGVPPDSGYIVPSDGTSVSKALTTTQVSVDKIFNDTSVTNPHFQLHAHNKLSALRMVSRVRTA